MLSLKWTSIVVIGGFISKLQNVFALSVSSSKLPPSGNANRLTFQPKPAFVFYKGRVEMLATNNDGGDDLEESDWRTFRANLLKMERNNSNIDNATFSSSLSRWAYDAGTLIEKGSLIVSNVEEGLGCHDLNQPYYHKAVILVLDHDDEFTKGVVLNRKTDLVLSDKDFMYVDDEGNTMTADNTDTSDSENAWKMSFGGDIGGLFDEQPEILFLHSVKTENGREFSEEVLNDIFVTNHNGALRILQSGDASQSDFFVTYGFAGWERGQLLEEIQRGSWSMVATDSETIHDILSQQDENHPCSAGLDTWHTLIKKVGKRDEKLETGDDNSFSDLMLKEWAAEMLVTSSTSIGDDETVNGTSIDEASMDTTNYYSTDEMIFRALNAAQLEPVKVGMLVRGSSLDPSPFLLHEQGLHKSIVLLFQDNERFSVGLILNQPTADKHRIELPGEKGVVEIPIRHGGSSEVNSGGGGGGEQDSTTPVVARPLVWLHCNQGLRDLRIGAPLDKDGISNIWTCSQDQAIQAIDLGLAFVEDFMVVEGFNAWEKEGGAGGIHGEILAGNFERVEPGQVDSVWSLLMSQETLTANTLDGNIKLSNDAWNVAGVTEEKGEDVANNEEGNLADGNDRPHNETRYVYGSNVEVSALADYGLRVWMTIFLLGDEKSTLTIE